MRRVPIVGALVMVTTSCMGFGGPTLTQPPPATDDTTPRTSLPAPDEPPNDVCPEGERGFTCPPDLPIFDPDLPFGGRVAVGPLGLLRLTAAPGIYRTRVFEPGFEFTAPREFQTTGEGSFFVDLGGHGLCSERCSAIWMLPQAEHFDITEAAADDECAELVETAVSAELFGSVGTRYDLVAIPGRGPQSPCRFDLPAGTTFVGIERDSVALVYLVTVGDHPLMVVVAGPERGFDEFWSTVAKPVLDSVSFVDS